jgi:hypothetical protein
MTDYYLGIINDYEEIKKIIDNRLDDIETDDWRKELQDILSDFLSSKEDLYEHAIEMAQKDAEEERAYMQNEYQRSQGIF